MGISYCIEYSFEMFIASCCLPKLNGPKGWNVYIKRKKGYFLADTNHSYAMLFSNTPTDPRMSIQCLIFVAIKFVYEHQGTINAILELINLTIA